MRLMACTVAVLLYALPLHAQTPSSAAPPAADVESIDAIIAALYDVISGPAGERDWDRFRSLFAADARLIPTGRLENGRWTPRTLSVDGYVERAGPQFRQQAFYEDELHREVQRFGHVAHAFSTYASRRAPDAEPFSRGINSIQLFWDGTRWWVVSVMWDAERDGQVIPPEYLGRSGLR